MILDKIALILAIIGGLNWGLVGLFRFDLVAYLFGGQTATVSRIVYTLVGIAAVWCISLLFRELGQHRPVPVRFRRRSVRRTGQRFQPRDLRARGPGGALVHFAPVPRHPRQGIKSQGPLNKRALTFFTLCHILHPRGVLTA